MSRVSFARGWTRFITTKLYCVFLPSHKEQMMYVFSTGLVLWEPSIVISSQCDMIITYFPFDYQVILFIDIILHNG